MMLQVAILVLSIVALYFGAELALDAAERIGLYFGLSPLVIGLLLIGFGTSLPEFFVSQLASYRGESEIALGNIIGSNIANLFLILGVSGLLSSMHILRDEIRKQFIYHIILTAFLGVALFFTGINLVSTALFAFFFAGYLFITFNEMKKQRQFRNVEESSDEEIHELEFLIFVKLLGGFVLLFLGGEYLVSSGTFIAKALGISAYVISAIFVAFGTSFPELVTALIASWKKKNTDLIVGNIIGSNIFNVAFVLGSIGFYKVDMTGNYRIEFTALASAAIFLLLLNLIKRNFSLIPGIIFLSTYVSMVLYWI
ncbi:MAG: calcium/sodium antiporter [Oligoflexia bacterium]|nr:calcium/sodium antiporter [Oligoflexia bacterium]